MNIDKIQALIALLKASDIQQLRLEDEDGKIELTRASSTENVAVTTSVVATPVPSVSPDPVTPTVSGTVVKAPLVATFYSRKSPSSAPFVSVGQKVKANDTLCVLEAMKVMNEIKAPVSGTIVKVHPTDGQLVMFDDVLFTIEEDHV